MAHSSPTLGGFRAAFRQPSLTLAEIAWRWTVGAVAGALFLFAFFEFLDTLPVTHGDTALLGTRQPLLVGRAIAHILRGSLNRAFFATLCAALALSLLWIIAASIGRGATVRTLLDDFRRGVSCNASSDLSSQSAAFRAVVVLHFFRLTVVLAALLALVGAVILANFASSAADPVSGLVAILFLPLAGFICLTWAALNWLLSLAGIFAVRDGEDALGAISATVTFLRERAAPIVAVSVWNGLAHLTALVGAFFFASLLLVFIQVAPTRFVVAGVLPVALAYFAVADWLYIARLAGYVCIAEMPETLGSSASSPVSPPAGQRSAPNASVQTTIDRDEPILSDLPGLAFEA